MGKQIMLTVASIAIAAYSYGQSKNLTTINVTDARKGQVPKPEPSKHKHHEAIVYRTSGKDGAYYKLVYYQKENDSMNYHAALYTSKDDMDKAAYSWNKDTIAVRIYNTSTKKEIKFRALGKGATSSMITD